MSQPSDNRNQNRQRQLSAEFLEVLKYEMALTAETMAQELTELQIMGYLEALSDLSIERIRAGFKRARRTLQFFPKPAEVRSLAAEEIEDNRNEQHFLPEADEPEWTPEERAKWAEDIAAACGKKPIPPPMTEAEFEKRRELLREQAQVLKEQKPCEILPRK